MDARARCRLTAEDVQQRRLTGEATHPLIVLHAQAVDLVAGADRRAGLEEAEVTPPVVAVVPQVVAAAEDIAVAAVRTEAVTKSYFHAGKETPSFGTAFLFTQDLISKGWRLAGTGIKL